MLILSYGQPYILIRSDPDNQLTQLIVENLTIMFSTSVLKKEGWKEAKIVKYDQIWHIPTSFNAGGITPTITV